MSDDLAALLAADPDQMTYEQARDGLSAIVNRLEGGSASLEESLALWEKGEALAKRCNQWLDGAEQRLAAASGKGPAERSRPLDRRRGGRDRHHRRPLLSPIRPPGPAASRGRRQVPASPTSR